MSVFGELLFYQGRNGLDLDNVLRHRQEVDVQEAVNGLPATEFSQRSDEELATKLLAKLRKVPLTLDLDKAVPEVKEGMVEVLDHFSRQRVRVRGLLVSKRIPYSGDTDLWSLRPNPYDLSPPYGTVALGHVTVGMGVREDEGERARTHLNDAIATIQQYIGWQTAQIEAFNAALPALVQRRLQQRRASLDKAADLLNKLKG